MTIKLHTDESSAELIHQMKNGVSSNGKTGLAEYMSTGHYVKFSFQGASDIPVSIPGNDQILLVNISDAVSEVLLLRKSW